MAGLFVTGTDTEVGKTLVSATLLVAMRQLGLRALGMKPIAAGAEQVDGRWQNEDVLALTRAASVPAPADLVNPYLFREPIAPHIAAERKGVRIEIPRIVEAYEALAGLADWIVVEGAGGFRVPLDARRDSADLAVALGLPVILVVGMRLGCINHALLTAEAVAARGLRLAGWVANRVAPDMPVFEENLATLEARLPAPCLAVIPHLPAADPEQAARVLPPRRFSAWLDSL
ncbi:dethiobiotin synthase [Parasulfuritortus cantonensis]|uniref:ATP-dependent dethiobiotin synthetase BioD n=1 Tax=Parasulfuritortus cantonensis TaxID=2528202 RepID=A0A4R1BLB9_9PROT|nr:dethiobiotin synthase [Parasulfuritortus cantonensis]TCJ18164.1 dethiobiotin synthase [Parasulfuritortus cantonensis]